jgi:hypothetical protein
VTATGGRAAQIEGSRATRACVGPLHTQPGFVSALALGFVPLPAANFLFLVVLTVTYVLLGCV